VIFLVENCVRTAYHSSIEAYGDRLYCELLNEDTGAGAALLLMQKGYTKVFALKGGWRAWEAAKYPVEPKGG